MPGAEACSETRFSYAGLKWGTICAAWNGKTTKRFFALGVPAIHVFVTARPWDVDARNKAGHHELNSIAFC